jgi:lipopolysaccharide export system permease protein
VLTFAIAMVFLILQFLWKYVDDLMGKGLSISIIAELLLYASANLVPMALPLAILLSSIMTFGNLGESSELTAMKSAGLSLLKIMRPLIIFTFLLSIAAFLFANYTWPVANLKFKSLLFDIQEKKPTLSLKEKMFYTDIPGYSIRVGKKYPNGTDFDNLLIYDNSAQNYFYKRDIVAEKGSMKNNEEESYMQLHLYNGKIYQELDPGIAKSTNQPFQRIYFKEGILTFDLSSLRLQRTSAELYQGHYEMLNMQQLAKISDSLKYAAAERLKENSQEIKNRFLVFRYKDTAVINQTKDVLRYRELDSIKQKYALNEALNQASSILQTVNWHREEYEARIQNIARHDIEWHRKITIPFACFVLFFVGAPLGAIIRKGGMGAPIVVSTVLFIFYYILSISGEKMAKSYVLSPFTGMWLSAIILVPVAAWLTYSSNNDSKLFDNDFYINLFRKIKLKK